MKRAIRIANIILVRIVYLTTINLFYALLESLLEKALENSGFVVRWNHVTKFN